MRRGGIWCLMGRNGKGWGYRFDCRYTPLKETIKEKSRNVGRKMKEERKKKKHTHTHTLKTSELVRRKMRKRSFRETGAWNTVYIIYFIFRLMKNFHHSSNDARHPISFIIRTPFQWLLKYQWYECTIWSDNGILMLYVNPQVIMRINFFLRTKEKNEN